MFVLNGNCVLFLYLKEILRQKNKRLLSIHLNISDRLMHIIFKQAKAYKLGIFTGYCIFILRQNFELSYYISIKVF